MHHRAGRLPAIVLNLWLWLSGPWAWAAQTLLQNDSFQSGDSVYCQAGFASGEMGASTLGPLTDPFTVQAVRFLFGGAADTVTVTLHVYLDSGSSVPGPELFSGDFQVTGSEQAMQEIDLSGNNIQVPAGSMVRVAIQVHHDGFPGLCRDADGIRPGRNWIYTIQGEWYDAQALGVQGDWVLRAIVDTHPAAQPDAGVAPDAARPDAALPADGAVPGQDAAVAPDGTGPSQDAAAHECSRSEDCSGGQICVNHTCVNVCHGDADCPGGVCFHGVCRVRCTTSQQCPGGQVCAQEMCLPGCLAPEDCAGGTTCREGACWPLCDPGDTCWTAEECVQGVCQPAGTGSTSGSSSGCGCRSGPPASPSPFLLLVLVGLLALRSNWKRSRE